MIRYSDRSLSLYILRQTQRICNIYVCIPYIYCAFTFSFSLIDRSDIPIHEPSISLSLPYKKKQFIFKIERRFISFYFPLMNCKLKTPRYSSANYPKLITANFLHYNLFGDSAIIAEESGLVHRKFVRVHLPVAGSFFTSVADRYQIIEFEQI